MIDELSFTKTIENHPKLLLDLQSDATVGAKVDYVTINGDAVIVHFTGDLSQGEIDAASAVVNGFVEASTEDATLEVTVQKEKAGRAALQSMVAHLNSNGDYFATVDGGIEGSELLWPIEAFVKRGFFVYAYRKFCLTVKPSSVTIYDQAAKDFFEAQLRQLALDYSGVDAATLDYVAAAAAGTV